MRLNQRRFTLIHRGSMFTFRQVPRRQDECGRDIRRRGRFADRPRISISFFRHEIRVVYVPNKKFIYCSLNN